MTDSFCDKVWAAAIAGLGPVDCVTIDEENVRLRLPTLGLNDEPLSIWIARVGEDIEVTDGGDTLWELGALGVDLQRSMRADFADALLAGRGVELRGDTLAVRTSVDGLGSALPRLAEAIVELGSLYYSSRGQQPRQILTSIEAALNEVGASFERNFRVRGASSLQRRFDFRVIRGHESLIRAVATDSDRQAQRSAELLAFHAQDLRKAHPDRFTFVMVFDDERIEWSDAVYRELEDHLIRAVPVSQPAEIQQAVAA